MTAAVSSLSGEPDLVDRQIIHAIQLQPRAPFALIAGALEVSEQTVARRFRRLEGSGLLRVLGLTAPEATGYERWILRIQCRPDAAAPLSAALARRGDVSWVSLSAGGSEIICMTRTRRDDDAQDLLLHRLPRTTEVNNLSAFSILHHFDPGTEWSGYGGEFDPSQQQRLRGPSRSGGPGRAADVSIGPDDGALLDGLARDGRASARTLAQQTGWSPARVSRRIDTLHDAGLLYFDVDLDVARLGFTTTAMLWLTVAPSDLAAVGHALTGHAEVAFAAAVTGSASLVASVVCRNPGDLYRYLTTEVSALSAVRQVETSLFARRVKQAGSILTPSGIARPAPR